MGAQLKFTAPAAAALVPELKVLMSFQKVHQLVVKFVSLKPKPVVHLVVEDEEPNNS